MLQLHTDELPDTLFGASFLDEPSLQFVRRLICRDDEVLLHGCWCRYCLEAELLLVQSCNVCDDKSRLLNGTLNGIPHTRLRVGELDRHPPSGLEHTVVLCLLYTSDAADDLLCVDLG